MYHRFEENKYPSTNVRIKNFKDHIRLIKENNIKIINPNNFEKSLKEEKKQKKLLLTVDDAFSSFYENAWPILKESETPFILFVSTREVGKFNYMTWEQIQEISKKSFVHIGNHSHTHEYLIDQNSDEIKKDIKKSISILEKKIGYKSNFFSYPFGEYSLEFKKIIKDLNFKYAFGQHSGVADESKDFLELPRFPINEKYGEIKRFNTILNTLPLKFQKILPKEKYINNLTNPPKINIEFFKNIKNLKLINCFSNEEDKWRKSKIKFIDDSTVEIQLEGKFTTERGRVNCSIREANNTYRWLGIQFVVAEK
jgi:poly-beta-1,6-N-acetyl-D-glucosamine N-deacetylase